MVFMLFASFSRSLFGLILFFNPLLKALILKSIFFSWMSIFLEIFISFPCKIIQFSSQADFCCLSGRTLEVNKSTKSKQYLGSTADLAKNLMSAMSACKSSKRPSKPYKVEKHSIFFLCSMQGVVKDK